jgi:hypothetical protein
MTFEVRFARKPKPVQVLANMYRKGEIPIHIVTNMHSRSCRRAVVTAATAPHPAQKNNFIPNSSPLWIV